MDTSPSFNIPDRPSDALNGGDFVNTIQNLGPTQQRDDLIFAELAKGNIPNFMRTPFEITVSENGNTLKYWVLPDVLCVGPDEDYVRTPIMAKIGKRVADLFNSCLPTKKMCNQIWANADLKLSPNPMGAPYTGDVMGSTDRFWQHNLKIEEQRAGRSFNLITGHKKDVLIGKPLVANKTRLGIYGWFYLNGNPIQDYQLTAHIISWNDYSQGVRLINRNVMVNDNPMDIYDVLKDNQLASLISDEGAYDASSIYG